MTSYKLKKLAELRIEVSLQNDVFITLQAGTAEVFGAELQLGDRLNIKGHALAVFTWEGCSILVEGEPDVIYTAEETPNVQYLNVHQVLQNQRQAAADAGKPGPRVMLVGPTDSGKSTLSRMLLNWAVRAGSQATYVDLDIGQGSITAPGCISATPIEMPIDVEQGYPLQVPLVYFFGHSSPSQALELYKVLVDKMASVLDRRAESSPQVAAAGMVINTMGWIDGNGYDLLLYCIKALQADVVLVVEQDRLFSQLNSGLKREKGSMGRAVSVVKLPKSGGVVAREADKRKQARTNRVREYFYGPMNNLQPQSQTVAAEKLSVFRIGGGFRAPSSALPLGATSKADPLKITPVTVDAALMQSLLAVSHAQTPDQLVYSNVAGFILVTDVDVTRGTVTYLSPTGGPLPGRYLLQGSQKVILD